MAPTKTAENVLIGYVDGYIAPENTSGPADTVALGGSWPAGWVHYGFTEEGLTLNWERDITDHFVEEQSVSVFSTIGESTFSIEFEMAETTLENLVYALGGGSIATIAAGSGIVGKKTLTISETPTPYAFGFEGRNQFGFFRRIIVPRGLFLGSLEVTYRRAEDKQLFGVEFRAACNVSDIVIVDKTANALA